MKPNHMLQDLLNVGKDIAVWNYNSKLPKFIKRRMVKKMINRNEASIYHCIYSGSYTLNEVASSFVVAVFNNSKLDIIMNDDRSRRYIFETNGKWYAIDVVNTLDDDRRSTLTKITIVISAGEYDTSTVENTIIVTMRNYEIEDSTLFNTAISDDSDVYEDMLTSNNADLDKYRKTWYLFKDTVFKFCMDVLKNDMEEN